MEDRKRKQWLAQVGNRVWTCRTQLNLTREQLAERLDISPQYVSEIEQGKKCMSMAIFVELGKALGVSLEYLAHGELPEDPALDRLERRLRQTTPLDRELAARMLLYALEAAEAMRPEEESEWHR